MRKFTILLSLVFVGFMTNAQTISGTIYSEHEVIDKTRALWNALVDGNEELVLSFFADSVYLSTNGNTGNLVPKENFRSGVDFWSKFKNLEVADDTPAFPDALVYNEGQTFVQDWIKLTGIHEATGVNLNISMHNLYLFDEEGKINTFIRYYNPSVFEDIDYGLTTRDNGEVYIYHPYIVTTRKLVNAYCAKDMDTILSFFNPDCSFQNSTLKWGKWLTIDEQKASLEERFNLYDEIRMEQIGYPDCIYYEEGNMYVVYSWWNHIVVVDGNEIEMPLMVSLTFNDEGKIVNEMDYYSSNHYEQEE